MGDICLEDFSISRSLGFLLDNPVEKLPDEFRIWSDLAKRIPGLVSKREFRQAVDKMPTLDYTTLHGYREQRLAHLYLTAIGACYVWQDGVNGAPKSIPACLAVPWYGLASQCGLTASVSIASMVLANWRLRSLDRPFELDNLDWICPFPGGEDAKWFFLIAVQMEKDFAEGLVSIETGVRCMQTRDVSGVADMLRKLQKVLLTFHATIKQTHERLDPEGFYNVVRPFMNGWGKQSPLPKGLIFSGVSETPKHVAGGSAAQSSIFQTVDAFLGVIHTGGERDFLLDMRNYMPPDHRRFIETLERRGTVRNFVEEIGDRELKKAYSDCVQAVVKFRSIHLQIVNRFVVIPSRRKIQKDDPSAHVRGTGGSALMQFLKSARSETTKAKFDPSYCT